MTEKYDVELWYKREGFTDIEKLWNDLKNAGIIVFNKDPKGQTKKRWIKDYREVVRSDFKARKKSVQKYIDGVAVGKPKKHTVYLFKPEGREVSASQRTALLRSGSVEVGERQVPNIKFGMINSGEYLCVSGKVYDLQSAKEPQTEMGKRIYTDLSNGVRTNTRPYGQQKLVIT